MFPAVLDIGEVTVALQEEIMKSAMSAFGLVLILAGAAQASDHLVSSVPRPCL